MSPGELIKDLTSGDDGRAEAAARQVPALGPQILPDLQGLLSSPQADSRWWAARALAEIDDPRVPRLLQFTLHDSDLSVRQCAALALRYQPDARAIPDLIAMLEDKDRLLARLVADALVAIGEAAVPALLEVMGRAPQAARLEAVRALSRIGDHRSIPVLFAALDEASALVEYWADQGLERMGVGMVFYRPGAQ
jgi:HEAT repeat protein